MEELDRRIVALLAADGRMSFTDLAKATGLSTSAAHQRVRRLESRGLIRGYGATISYEDVGLPMAALISVRPLDQSQPDDIPERLSAVAAIESCWSVAGEASYVLLVRVAGPAALEDLIAQIRNVAGVSTTTTVVLSTPFERRPVPS